MNWSDSLDLYCERTDPSLWSEPLNALSNLGFLLVAGLMLRRLGPGGPRDLRLLALLVGLVGLGSLAFHTLATRGSAVLDVGFIALFILVYYQRLQVRLLGLREGRAWAGVGVFLVLALGFGLAVRQLPPLPLNGSEIYLPPLALLVYCAVRSHHRRPASARWLGLAGLGFVFSLGCRMADQALCPIWPLGTHVGWHLGNALVLYTCLSALFASHSKTQWFTPVNH